MPKTTHKATAVTAKNDEPEHKIFTAFLIASLTSLVILTLIAALAVR